MVVVTWRADSYLQAEGKIISQTCPTAWHFSLVADGEAVALAELAKSFGDVPAKCPQKALKVVAA
jgi:hypothetical protein